MAEWDEGLRAGGERGMHDSSGEEGRREAAGMRRRLAAAVTLEVSGNVTPERLPVIAASGVDFVSVGALTHSAPALDLSLNFLGDDHV